MQLKNYRLPPLLVKAKHWIGYGLFAGAITYGLWSPPPELWRIEPLWLFFAALVAFAMFILQAWQVMVFLKYHDVQTNWLYPLLFTARKSVLNTILPAKSGTFALMPMLTTNYQLKWYNFIKFMLTGSVASLLVSLISVVWLLLPLAYSLLLLLLILVFAYLAVRYTLFTYASCFPSLLLIATLLYFCTIMAFFCLLRGLGFQLSIMDISYFAVVLNALAQFSFTPGNIGVREIVVGFMAPYVSLAISTGVIASAVFFIIRLLIYSVILLVLEWLFKKSIAPISVSKT
ncbi:MAG: hypothetical protein GY705_06890 [Bacteroidetes bacterium]|nr:hypothetical protein [Bacteroidota bacterium]